MPPLWPIQDLCVCCWCQYVLTRYAHVPSVPSEQTKSNLKVTSPEDVEHVSRRQASPNGTAPSKGDAKGSRTVPRRHTLGGARGSREILAMQPSDMDKKREAFLEHLKQKYPHHASAIMGHQERLREQVSRVTDVWLCHVVVCLFGLTLSGWSYLYTYLVILSQRWQQIPAKHYINKDEPTKKSQTQLYGVFECLPALCFVFPKFTNPLAEGRRQHFFKHTIHTQ